ncbi:hypothetical protein NDU88_003854 [Pleurodeles waltl]|uniref:Uncharacterized protein n=1 Tax=Pleurodeles waltl TaxID=8319 RepID=A0AAV7T617_PLEWA|nr:hypothetical protein NDU88_003854 [Pleurodeles waltl]
MGPLGGSCAGVPRGVWVCSGLCLCEGNRLSRGSRWSGLVISVQVDRAAVIADGLLGGGCGEFWALRGGVLTVGCVEFKSSNVAEFCSFVCILTAAVCTANGKPRLKDRRVDSWVIMAWAYFCWRDGGGLVTSTFPPTAGLAVCCGCRIFGGLAAAGQNDRGGLPRPQRNYGGFLTGGRRLLPPRSE